jgi:hypothetical protein
VSGKWGERSHVSDLSFHLKGLEREKQIKAIIGRRKRVVKISFDLKDK